MPVASIVILTYNNLEVTRLCLNSIYAKTDHPSFEVIIVDNASQDGTAAFLRDFAEKHENVRLILNSTNEGFARGNNRGASIASGEYLVFLNNDTVVTRGWLEGLIRHLKDDNVGMVGPVTNASGNETCILVDYQDLTGLDEFAERYTQAHTGQAFEIEMLPFLCVALKREVYEKIGPLDERFNVGMFEDDDYAIRLKQKGLRLLCAEDVFIHHWGSASFGRFTQPHYRKIFTENLRKFEEKWGTAWQPHLYRPELLRLQMRQMIDDAAFMALQIEERDQTISRLKGQLDEIHRSRAWSLVQVLWALRIWIAPRGSLRARLMRSLLKPFWAGWTVLVRSVQYLTREKLPPMISWPAYAFYRYRRARQKIYSTNFEGVACPGEAGMVSVILPVYNGADYLREAIESVLSQTYEKFELIIVDDGSTDLSPQIAGEYAQKDSRIRVIHQTNQKLPAALNTGHRLARGEFVTWISADNRLKPDFLQKMSDSLRRHPDWDMIYANLDLIGPDGEPLRQSAWYAGYQNPPGSEHIAMPEDLLELNVVANNSIGAAFMYRRRVNYLLGEYSSLRFGMEDYDYWMRVNALLTLHHADFSESVYEYRFHPSSLTSQDEELGITRRREGLMVFEDARRDFYLTPLSWFIEAGQDAHAQELAEEVRNWVRRAGHRILTDSRMNPVNEEVLWNPKVMVRIAARPDDLEPSPIWPPTVKKILVYAGERSILPSAVSAEWDVCVWISGKDTAFPPTLPRPYQGWLSVPDGKTLCNVIDVYVKSSHMAKLEAEIAQPQSPRYKISVVVCTYRRGVRLKEALVSLARQTFPASDYEVIVVNNDPDDATPERVVEELKAIEFADRPEQLRFMVHPFQGLSFARNAGIAAAKGEVIAFIDDDALAFPDWLEQVWEGFHSSPHVGVVGGNIYLLPPANPPGWLKPGWYHYWSQYLIPNESPTLVDTWQKLPWGCNWSARRDLLLKIGGFRTSYGRKGTNFSGGEELVAAILIQRLGYQVILVPASKVYHSPDPGRYSIEHVKKTIIHSLLGRYQQQIDLYLPPPASLRSIRHERNLAFAKALFSSAQPHERLDFLFHAWGHQRVIRRLRDDLTRRKRLFH